MELSWTGKWYNRAGNASAFSCSSILYATLVMLHSGKNERLYVAATVLSHHGICRDKRQSHSSRVQGQRVVWITGGREGQVMITTAFVGIGVQNRVPNYTPATLTKHAFLFIMCSALVCVNSDMKL